jgi:hypothetical protein
VTYDVEFIDERGIRFERRCKPVTNGPSHHAHVIGKGTTVTPFFTTDLKSVYSDREFIDLCLTWPTYTDQFFTTGPS